MLGSFYIFLNMRGKQQLKNIRRKYEKENHKDKEFGEFGRPSYSGENQPCEQRPERTIPEDSTREPIAEGNVEPRRQQVLPVTDGKVERTISPAVIKDGTSTRRNKSKLARTLGRRRRRSAK